MLIIEKNPILYHFMILKNPLQPPTYVHVQYQLLCTPSSALGGSFNLHTSEFKYEIERKNWWMRTKHLPAAMHWGKKCSSLWVSVCSAKAFCGHVPTLLCKVNHFSYSLYTAQTRYTKYWSIRGVCVSHPTLPTTFKQWKHSKGYTTSASNIQAHKQLESALQLTVVKHWLGNATELSQLFLVPDDVE